MAEVAQRHAAAARVRDEVARLSACLGSDEVVEDAREALLRPPGLLSLAHLVAWTGADAYHAFMTKVQEANSSRFEIHRTGPWPPYSFVE